MHLPQLLVLLFIVFSDKVSAAPWLQNRYPRSIVASGKQSSSKRSSLPSKIGFEGLVNHFANYDSNTFPESVLTGGMATFDVYSFTNLKDSQSSVSAIWVTNEQGNDQNSTNVAVAGWEVNPARYDDTKTHFFTQWTADGYNSTGCENLACDGFVPVNNAPITPGDTIEATGGQTKITIKIFKSKEDGDWWLHFGYDNKTLSRVGYWPKSIFTNLADHANYISWGGYTGSLTRDASPAMGNGQWPGETAAFVRDVKYVNTDGQGDSEPAPGHMGLRAHVSHPNCYGLSSLMNDMFSYGGPGGCTE